MNKLIEIIKKENMIIKTNEQKKCNFFNNYKCRLFQNLLGQHNDNLTAMKNKYYYFI